MLRVLAYHRIAEFKQTPAGACPNISATPANFNRQMRHLARHYRVVSMPEVLDAVERNSALPNRAVLITFDDAYADFADNAWPILRQYGMAATLFVPTAYPDHPELKFWWERLYYAFANTNRLKLPDSPLGPLPLGKPAQRRRSLLALFQYVPTRPYDAAMKLVDAVCAQLLDQPAPGAQVLSWFRLRQLASEGVTLGSHSCTHPIMTQISPMQIREEIRRSQLDLKREIGFALPIFCYPNGDHNDTVTKILRAEGISLAFTVLPGENHLDSAGLLRIGRTCIWPRTSLPVFYLRLQRMGIRLDSWRQNSSGPAVTHKWPQTEAGLE
jgi:peptidoglycan/xylan/chitin deacetylase (PgdA/CDA1 family)